MLQKRSCTTRHIVAVLVFDDFLLLDAAGPIAAFELSGLLQNSAKYDIRIVAVIPGLVTSSSGVKLQALGLREVPVFDTLLVPGGIGAHRAALDPQILTFVRSAHLHQRRVASVCTGAFVLAAAGLLNGRSATTHWGEVDELARRYPQIKVSANKIFVHSEAIWTSAGITAGIDLTIALIEEDFGESAAKAVARAMVMYHRRPGGQSQSSVLLNLAEPYGRFSKTLSWARENMSSALTVERLAARHSLSARQFSRAFRAELGLSPAKAIEKLRIEAARSQIESSSANIRTIAERTGFGSLDRLRRAFLRAFKQTPQDMRRSAREIDLMPRQNHGVARESE